MDIPEKNKSELPDLPAQLSISLASIAGGMDNFNALDSEQRRQIIEWISKAGSDPIREERIAETKRYIMRIIRRG